VATTVVVDIGKSVAGSFKKKPVCLGRRAFFARASIYRFMVNLRTLAEEELGQNASFVTE